MHSLLLIVVVLLSLGLFGVLRLWPYKQSASFSQHVARSREGIVYYFCLFALTLPLLLWFVHAWLLPEFALPSSVFFATLASSALQVACTLIPETHGWRVETHRTLAGLSGLLLIPAEWLIFTSLPTSNTVRFSFVIGLVCQLLLLAILQIKHLATMSWRIQALYYFCFFGPLILLTYL